MKTTMHDRLMKLLRQRYVTPLDALKHAGCMSLAQRVSQWRAAGIRIDDKWVHLENGVRVKAYRIAPKRPALDSVWSA